MLFIDNKCECNLSKLVIVDKNITFSSTNISDLMKAFELVKFTFENVSIYLHSKMYITKMKQMLHGLSVKQKLSKDNKVRRDAKKLK